MKKGIFFALLYGAIFLLFFSMLAYYSQYGADRSLLLQEGSRLRKFASIADDVKTDLLGILRINSISINRNSTHAIISIDDNFPIAYSNPQNELISYESYFEGPYAASQNLAENLQIDLNSIYGAPFLYFNGVNLNYSHSDLDKSSATFKGSNSIEKYSVFILSDPADPISSCAFSTQIAGDLELEIGIQSPNCPSQQVFLDPNPNSLFFANTTSGKYLNVSIGFIDGSPNSIKISNLDGIKLNILLNATISTIQPITAWLPVGLEFNPDYALSTLVIAEN
ncbi:MAG: hypothetical protein AABX01_03400 [Candidatus Micrarchaeota archaeon]